MEASVHSFILCNFLVTDLTMFKPIITPTSSVNKILILPCGLSGSDLLRYALYLSFLASLRPAPRNFHVGREIAKNGISPNLARMIPLGHLLQKY